MKMYKPTPTLALAAVLIAGMLAPAHAVTAPYTNDYSSSVADFTTAGGSWALNSGTYDMTLSAGAAVTSTAMVNVSNLGAGKDFMMTTIFTSGAINEDSDATFGFAALGNTSTPSSYILADVGLFSAGGIRLYEIGGSGGNQLITSTTRSFAILEGTAYTLTLVGEYTESGLELSFTITDGDTQTQTITGTTTENFTGTNYGYRNRNNHSNAGAAISASYDSLSIVAVPEASTTALLSGLAVLLIAGFWRRRQ